MWSKAILFSGTKQYNWCQLSDGNHNITILVTHSFFHLVRYYLVVNWTAEVHLYHFLRKLNENIIIKMLNDIGPLWSPIKVHFIRIMWSCCVHSSLPADAHFCQKFALILPAIYEGVQKWRYLCRFFTRYSSFPLPSKPNTSKIPIRPGIRQIKNH